jgi:hypothetical protein
MFWVLCRLPDLKKPWELFNQKLWGFGFFSNGIRRTRVVYSSSRPANGTRELRELFFRKMNLDNNVISLGFPFDKANDSIPQSPPLAYFLLIYCRAYHRNHGELVSISE